MVRYAHLRTRPDTLPGAPPPAYQRTTTAV
jgi:hypothetical protein